MGSTGTSVLDGKSVVSVVVGCDVGDCCTVDSCGEKGRAVEGRAMDGF